MSDSETEQAAHHTDYRLKVTAGPSYDSSTHHLVPVNSPKTLTFENEHIIVTVAVRIRHFTGYPPDSPETSPYFEHELHASDQYSIAFSFIPKQNISGEDLVFGNDFDRPIRDRLPPGFNQALRIVKWWIDPGLDGDAYADKPYLYGPALSSWNFLRVGDRVYQEDKIGKDGGQQWKIPNADSFHEDVVEEGGDDSGLELRENQGIPEDAAGRKKFFLTQSNREGFTFEAGRLYQSDFGNPYLDFNDFSLKLPGFNLNVIKYIDSKSHELRYTLKNRATGDVYAVVLFTLLFGEELEEEAKTWAKPEAAQSSTGKTDTDKREASNSAAKSKGGHDLAADDDDDEGVD